MNLNISQYDIDNKVYLCVVSSNTTLVDYQIEVINNNKELPILNLKIQSINNINKFSFDITGYISLKDYMNRPDINKNTLIKIVYNIINTIINTENYLLKKSNLILNYENVYVNILTTDIKMIYVPVKEKVNEEDYNIIREFLLGPIRIISKLDPTNILVTDIIKYLEKEYYKLIDVKKKIDTINNQEIVPVVRVEESVTKTRSNKNASKVKKHNKASTLIVANIVTVVMVVILLVLKIDNIMKIAIIVVILGLDIATNVVLLVKNNEGKENNKIIDREEMAIVENRRKALTSYFYFDGEDSKQKFYINKDIFLIGRLAEVVDYAISNSAIGRVHARIEKENDEHYLTDLASRNGSFIDGNRLNTNVRYLLHDGCQVRLANTILYFKK